MYTFTLTWDAFIRKDNPTLQSSHTTINSVCFAAAHLSLGSRCLLCRSQVSRSPAINSLNCGILSWPIEPLRDPLSAPNTVELSILCHKRAGFLLQAFYKYQVEFLPHVCKVGFLLWSFVEDDLNFEYEYFRLAKKLFSFCSTIIQWQAEGWNEL